MKAEQAKEQAEKEFSEPNIFYIVKADGLSAKAIRVKSWIAQPASEDQGNDEEAEQEGEEQNENTP